MRGDASESFEFVEETLNLMTLLTERPVNRRNALSRWIGLDLGLCSEILCDESPQPIRIVGCVRNDMTDAPEPG